MRLQNFQVSSDSGLRSQLPLHRRCACVIRVSSQTKQAAFLLLAGLVCALADASTSQQFPAWLSAGSLQAAGVSESDIQKIEAFKRHVLAHVNRARDSAVWCRNNEQLAHPETYGDVGNFCLFWPEWKRIDTLHHQLFATFNSSPR